VCYLLLACAATVELLTPGVCRVISVGCWYVGWEEVWSDVSDVVYWECDLPNEGGSGVSGVSVCCECGGGERGRLTDDGGS
jgi:hypothetical protein